jgi:hypothetical protein
MIRMTVVSATLALALALSGIAQAQSVKLTGLGGETASLSVADIAALPHEAVTLQLEGKTAPCEGVRLSVLLAKVGAPSGKAIKGPDLADVVEVDAADGYRVVLALAETDAVFRPNRVILADRCNGAPLGAGEGPFRMVVEGDLRPARAARQVTAIALRRLPAP